MLKKRFENLHVSFTEMDLSKWPSVNESSLKPEKKEVFLKRKTAVELYFNSEKSIHSICEEVKVTQTDLYRIIERCLFLDEYGNIYGFRALISGYRIKKYKRTKEINGFQLTDEVKAGAFE